MLTGAAFLLLLIVPALAIIVAKFQQANATIDAALSSLDDPAAEGHETTLHKRL